MATGLRHVVEKKAGKSCHWGEEPHEECKGYLFVICFLSLLMYFLLSCVSHCVSVATLSKLRLSCGV
jgi:hypothetical protein